MLIISRKLKKIIIMLVRIRDYCGNSTSERIDVINKELEIPFKFITKFIIKSCLNQYFWPKSNHSIVSPLSIWRFGWKSSKTSISPTIPILAATRLHLCSFAPPQWSPSSAVSAYRWPFRNSFHCYSIVASWIPPSTEIPPEPYSISWDLSSARSLETCIRPKSWCFSWWIILRGTMIANISA